jgi:hypothetical protein
MKKLMMGLVLLFAAAGTYAQVTVHAEQGNNIDYSNYKSFAWASSISNDLEPGVYFLNDLVLKAQIREAVKGELMGRGYQLSQNPEQSDMVVNFRVFDKPVTLKGSEGYGDDYWGSSGATSSNYSYITDDTSYEVQAGTLLISLADRKNGKVFWQGFASGLIDNNQFVKDEVKIREAVKSIFDEYSQNAKAYSRK